MKKMILLFLLIAIACSKEKEISITTDFCKSVKRNDTISLSKEMESISDKIKTKSGVFVLENGGNSMITRAWLSEYAEKTIDIQYFIFSMDNVGLIACDYLVRAADRGVKVRIIVDDFMVDAEIEDILKFNAHENIEIKIYNPGVNLGKNLFGKLKKFAIDFRGANQRMHNKTFIVDGEVVITGGRNIADEYFDFDHEYNFRDRDVLLFGKVTNDIQSSFNLFWDNKLSVKTNKLLGEMAVIKSNSNQFDNLHEYACNPENFWPQIRNKINHFQQTINEVKKSDGLIWLDDVSFVSDVPGKNDGKSGLGGGGLTTTKLIDLIKNAKTSIEIQTPYLITTTLSRDLFKNAIDRGVKIRILTNSLASTDNVEAFASYQSDRKKLLQTGVRIFEFKPNAAIRKKIMTSELQSELAFVPTFGFHAKSMVIDNETTVIGTFNLDPRSANLNTECITIIKSNKVSEEVLKLINEEFKPENAWETTLKFNPDSKVKKLKRIKSWTRKILPKNIL